MKRMLSLFLICLLSVTLACGSLEAFEEDPIESDDQSQADEGVAVPQTDAVEEPAAAVAGGGDGVYERADCPFDSDADVECGYLTVPENRTKADSPLIQLAVAILYAPDGSTELPIVFLEGGPGGSSLAEFSAEEWDFPFTRNRDLIFIDQRGTGYSIPTLDCPELSDETYDLSQENPEMDCRERLVAEGVDLTAYNTTENAADIAALRSALDIEAWDLLGVSYGTRLALDVMRFHPEGVRAVILDSPFPPNADTAVDELVLTYELMEALFATCADDAYCGQEYPDLENVFLETVAALNEGPADDLSGDSFFQSVSSAMQDTSLIPLIPYVIYEVNGGNYDALDEIKTDSFSRRHQFQDSADRSDSEGMYNSVMCHDEYSFGDYGRTEDAVAGRLPQEVEGGLLQSSFEFFQMCSFWGAGAANSVENMAVSSNIPTLILVGEFDTATPPHWATLTAQSLSNSYVFVFPGAGHSLLTTTACSVDIITEFLNDPATEPDRTCIDNIEWPYFE
ncbi:MAG: alpha/beta hydrolase [Anaerolineales bacterium]|nr:alpha/beta hydrolase [Anaerolineales bacterium]